MDGTGSVSSIVAGARLGDVVAWTLDVDTPRTRSRHLLGGVAAVVASVFAAMSGLMAVGPAAPRPSDRLPPDPGREVYLDGLYADTGSPWTPAEPGSGAIPVHASLTDAWTQTDPLGGERRPIPLATMHVVRLEPDGAETVRTPSSRWRLTVSDGHDELTLAGTWLALAYLAALAHWPEPPR